MLLGLRAQLLKCLDAEECFESWKHGCVQEGGGTLPVLQDYDTGAQVNITTFILAAYEQGRRLAGYCRSSFNTDYVIGFLRNAIRKSAQKCNNVGIIFLFSFKNDEN